MQSLPTRAKAWGNVARRGARDVTRRNVRDGDGWSESTQGRRAHEQRGAASPGSAPPRGREVAWVRDDGASDEWADRSPASTAKIKPRPKARPGPSAAGGFSASRALAGLTTPRATLPPEVATEIRQAADVATARHRELLVERAESAAVSYERGRSQDALRMIKPVAEEVPGVAGVRELAGLAAYQSNRWREAARHLQAYGRLTDSVDHVPVLMDCQRALHKPKKVAELWSELRHSSADPDVLAEGRIVAAATLAEGGDLDGAISLLATAGAAKALRNPSDRHVRQWYVLADLYERAGDMPRARQYFERVAKADPGAYDVTERLRNLGPGRRARPKKAQPKRVRPSPRRAAATS